MKKRFIIIMLVLLLFSYNSIGAYEYHEEITEIEYLLNKRIEIMNEFLYGVKNLNSLENKLKVIETESILENDVDILEKVIDNPTDYELAVSVSVDKINTLDQRDDCIYVNLDLNWLMRGYDGEFNMVKNYDIKCTLVEERLFLASFSIND